MLRWHLSDAKDEPTERLVADPDMLLARVMIEFGQNSRGERLDPSEVNKLYEEIGALRRFLGDPGGDAGRVAVFRLLQKQFRGLMKKLPDFESGATKCISKVPPSFLSLYPDLFSGAETP